MRIFSNWILTPEIAKKSENRKKVRLNDKDDRKL